MSLTFALETLEAAQFGIYVASETENHMTSVERVFTYTEIDPEPGYCTETQSVPEDWPTAGSMALHDLSLTYLEGAPAILNGINVCFASQEKVGVVGRTGAGKSSLVANRQDRFSTLQQTTTEIGQMLASRNTCFEVSEYR